MEYWQRNEDGKRFDTAEDAYIDSIENETKEDLLNTGEKAITANIPNNPVIQTKRRKAYTTLATRVLSPVPCASATLRTALDDKPKEVSCCTKPVAEVYNPWIPTPVGPKSTAINLDLITSIKILYTCTPPNKDVALNIPR